MNKLYNNDLKGHMLAHSHYAQNVLDESANNPANEMLGQLYDCPSASEVTLKDMSKNDQHQSITKTKLYG